MYEGHILLHRKLLDWEWYDDPNTKSLFIHLLLLANWKEKKWHGIEIKRGQLVASQHSLAVKLGLSRQELRSSLVRLKSTNEITIKSTKTYTLITVNKYDSYQTYIHYEQPSEQPSEQPTSNQQATNEQPLLIKKERNKDNNTNAQFEEFWNLYGKKIDRSKCYNWYKKNGSNGTHEKVMEGLNRWKQSGQWDDPQYQPYPYTFLFNKRYEDEPPKKLSLIDQLREQATKRFLKGEKT